MINMFERKKHSVRAKFRILKAKTLIKRIIKFRKYLPSVNLSLKSLFSEAAVHRCFSQMLGKHLCWPLQTSFSEHLRWLLLDFRGSKYFFQLTLVFTVDSHTGFCSELLWKHELNDRRSHWNSSVKKGLFRTFASFTFRPAALLKRHSNTDVFLWSLQNV